MSNLTVQAYRAGMHDVAAIDALDDGLDRLQGTGPEWGPGFSNHGPMAMEAMVRLGRADAVARWADTYRKRLRPAIDPQDGLDGNDERDWRSALGRIERAGDWIGLFQRQLADEPWQPVVSRWALRLVPGVWTAATHGLIRTAHAARALEEADTPLRRHELAEALGYWASRYQEIGFTPNLRGPLTIGKALAELPALPPNTSEFLMISDVARVLRRLDGWSDSVDALDPAAAGAADADARDALSDLTEAMAGLFVANPGNSPIAYCHAVTGPAALRILLPYLPVDAYPTAFAYAWQAAAAIATGYGWAPTPLIADDQPSRADLIDQAVANGDEHVIKLTEACLREHRLTPSPVYFAAANQIAQQLQGI